MLWKSKSTVVPLLIKSTSLLNISNKKLKSTKFSILMMSVMLSVSLKVKDSPVSLRDGVLRSYQRRLTEVQEKLVVSEPGIQPESLGLVQELVNQVITTELK